MSSRLRRKNRTAQRQRLRFRLIVAGTTLALAGAGFLFWLQVSEPEPAHATVVMELSQDQLPHAMKVEAMIESPADTSNRGIRVKQVKPLSMTPELPAY